MVGTLRFAHPTHCELICFARNRNRDAQPRQIKTTQITSDFPKSCQVQESKKFRLTCRPNHLHNSACLTADEGRWPSSRTCGEMRWTRELRLTCVARAYGEVVWFGRRGAGVKPAIRSAGDGGKRAVLREEHEVSRKAIAQGRPECFPLPCMLVCRFVCANRTRDRGCSKHPVFPAPSKQEGGKFSSKPRAQCAARSRSRICVGWVERSETHHLLRRH
jgi:hypothetical protein